MPFVVLEGGDVDLERRVCRVLVADGRGGRLG